MPKNRRKSSFASEALLECQDKKSSIVSTYSISSRTRRRRSSMATLNPSQSQFEKNVIPNSKANISACVPRKSSPPPSPVLKTSFKSQSYKDSSLENSINSECDDDTLIAKFARDTDRNAEKLAERCKANATQVTATNFTLQDAVKIFPELLMDFSKDIFRKEGKSAGPFYGLPMKVKELMVSTRGIKKFYAWQEECLSLPSIVQGKNFLYTLPTSGGKTLVAEMLIMKELMCMKRDAMLVLPFVAIVQEKVRGIAQFADELDFLVEEYAGSKGKFPPTKRRKRKSLFICTIEKANTLVNSLIEAGRLDTLGLVVIDELHMLGEGGRRGAAIEMTLSKIMHVSRSTQIIGMTATLSNIEDLSKFLNAEVYKNNFRPVTLDEFVKVEECLYRVDNKGSNPEEGLALARVLKCPDKEIAAKDTDHIVTLLLEIVPKHSSLVFCPTKKNCENVALLICKLLPSSFKELHVKEKRAILETLYQDSGGEGLCPVLMKTIPYGVAYHHSGLTSDERSLIESAYNNGVLCVITCTSTLAAGVNLPARRVIIRSPYIGQGFLSRSQYKQMIGRAGRAGIDTKGESVLIVTKSQDRGKVMELVTGPVETCVSSLMYDGVRGFKTLILNLIHLKIMTKMSDVKDFFKQTLIAVQLKSMPDRFEYIATGDAALTETVIVEKVTKNVLQELLDLKLIRLRSIKENIDTEEVKDVADCSLEVTKLGAATNRGSIDFSISNAVYEDLVAGLKNLVLTSYLHLLYLAESGGPERCNGYWRTRMLSRDACGRKSFQEQEIQGRSGQEVLRDFDAVSVVTWEISVACCIALRAAEGIPSKSAVEIGRICVMCAALHQGIGRVLALSLAAGTTDTDTSVLHFHGTSAVDGNTRRQIGAGETASQRRFQEPGSRCQGGCGQADKKYRTPVPTTSSANHGFRQGVAQRESGRATGRSGSSTGSACDVTKQELKRELLIYFFTALFEIESILPVYNCYVKVRIYLLPSF